MAEKQSLIPRPPKPSSMADFVVIVFALLIVTSLMFAVVGLGVLALVQPDRDLSGLIAILADIFTTIIGALVGYIAGRGQTNLETVATTRKLKEEVTQDIKEAQ